MRNRLVVMVLALMLASAGVVVAGAPAGASAPRATGDDVHYDDALRAALVAEGVDEAAALFLAMTSVDAREIDDRHARIVEEFPGGTRAVIDVRITPVSAADAAAPPELTTQSSSRRFAFSFEYVVPLDGIPGDVRSAMRVVAPGPVVTTAPASVVWARATSAPAAGDTSGVQVAVKAVATKYVSNQASDYVKQLDGKTGGRGDLLKLLKAKAAVEEAAALGDEFDAMNKRIDELEDCAKNPTNPLTKKAYREDPKALDRILDQVESTRQAIKDNTTVGFIAMMNKTASGVIKNAPWLGYVVSAGTAWSKDALNQVNQELLDQLEKAVVPCTKDYKLDGVIDGLRFTAIKCAGAAGQWDLTLTAVDPSTDPAEGSVVFDREPEAGGAVDAVSSGIRLVTWDDAREFSQGSTHHFLMTFYAANGPNPPAIGIDETIGGVRIPVEAGRFCKE